MTNTTAGLRRKIAGARDLQSVVRTMKALAASNIGQYERSVRAVADYARSVELGLSVCFRALAPSPRVAEATAGSGCLGMVVFGSDQGLVGGFNDIVAEHALKALADRPGERRIWAVGERVQAILADSGPGLEGGFAVPNSVKAIAPLVGQILLETEAHDSRGTIGELWLFYNRPTSGAVYEPVSRRLLPLDDTWRRSVMALPWPTPGLPEVLASETGALRAFIREYLFVSLFRACAESLASENASRLAAMQRAEKNIGELLEGLVASFHRLRQSSIDEELFDVVSGFEALGKRRGPG